MNISLFLRLILDVKNAEMSGICPRVCSKKCWLQAANFHPPCLSQHYYIVCLYFLKMTVFPKSYVRCQRKKLLVYVSNKMDHDLYKNIGNFKEVDQIGKLYCI
jgi:hypothetical protein